MLSIHELFSEAQSPLFSIAMDGRGGPRPLQAEYADAVQKLLDLRRGIGLFQGETGSGKTLGYLVPALLHAARTRSQVIISTQTLSLQKQIIDNTLPGVVNLVRHETGVVLKVARRIGRRNFLSIPALENKIAAFKSASPMQAALSALLEEIVTHFRNHPDDATRQFLFEEFGQKLADKGAPAGLFANLDIGSHEDDDAAYKAMAENALDANVLVVNHALLATDLIASGKVLGIRAPHSARRTLIVDEADALPSMAQHVMSRKLTIQELHGASTCFPHHSKEAIACAKAVNQLATSFNALAKSEWTQTIKGHNTSVLSVTRSNVRTIAASLARPLYEVQDALTNLLDNGQVNTHDVEITLTDIAAILRNFKTMQAGEVPFQSTSLYWTPVRHFPGFHIDGGAPGRIISKLWRQDDLAPDTLLFTSATLTAGADRSSMKDFVREIGMGDDTYARTIRRYFAPDDFGKMDFVIADQITVPPVALKVDRNELPSTNPEIFDCWKAMIAAAVREGGRILVLMTSYDDAKELYSGIGTSLGRTPLLDGKEQANAILRAFEADPSAILVTPNRWAGLDMPGKIRHIVIPRIPLEPPDLVRDALRESVMEARGLSHEQIVSSRFPTTLAHARRKLLQGMGRGIRVETDQVTIWIGDSRWPLSIERQQQHPDVKTPNWARTMAGAIPVRFRSSLEHARIFPFPEETKLGPPKKTVRKGASRTPKSKIALNQHSSDIAE